MPMGTRHRVTGFLKDSRRGLILEVDGGGVYALDAEPGARQFLGRKVTVEGVRSGFDRLDVDWIGAA
ncbi:DUF5818 domain-containing protein [Sphingomonas sp. R647]|uniref:DUF5818 domain-containing protein n=1 Tax=Sphingomonas sp. R647 TaxID=2875233 RepID=UPI001CD26A56|nr:DUF5818 domain-containing protein [Sphingomonas sp. R647]MCA1200185.1 DUF5818 domain-containing protein [Sphingomonas sp. R647]